MKANGNFEKVRSARAGEESIMSNCECGGVCECTCAEGGAWAHAKDGACGTLQGACVNLLSSAQTKLAHARQDESGQGTTEYAILVGVLVVIAILAITVFRGKIQELWTAIQEGIMGL